MPVDIAILTAYLRLWLGDIAGQQAPQPVSAKEGC